MVGSAHTHTHTHARVQGSGTPSRCFLWAGAELCSRAEEPASEAPRTVVENLDPWRPGPVQLEPAGSWNLGLLGACVQVPPPAHVCCGLHISGNYSQ